MKQNGFPDYRLGVVQNKITRYWFLPSCDSSVLFSVSPVLWWALARAFCSSTCRGFKVRQDDKERGNPLVRSTDGLWPAKIYQRQIVLKMPPWTWEASQFDSSSVCFSTLHVVVAKLIFSMLLIFPCVPLQWCEPPSSDVAPFPSLKLRFCSTPWMIREKQQEKKYPFVHCKYLCVKR